MIHCWVAALILWPLALILIRKWQQWQHHTPWYYVIKCVEFWVLIVWYCVFSSYFSSDYAPAICTQFDLQKGLVAWVGLPRYLPFVSCKGLRARARHANRPWGQHDGLGVSMSDHRTDDGSLLLYYSEKRYSKSLRYPFVLVQNFLCRVILIPRWEERTEYQPTMTCT